MLVRIGLGLGAWAALWLATGASALSNMREPPWIGGASRLATHVVPSLVPTPDRPASAARSVSPNAAGDGEARAAPQGRGQQHPPAVGVWRTEVRAATVAPSLQSTIAALSVAPRVVPFTAPYAPGAIVIVNRERALYHVGPDRSATRYPVAVGSFAEEWTGVEFVTDKKVNPTWYPVQEPGAAPRDPVPGGDRANPLGARALYLGRTLWRIHGTPAVESIGHAVSAGCIRMRNEHVAELYDKVMLGTEVFVVDRLADPAPVHRGRKVVE